MDSDGAEDTCLLFPIYCNSCYLNCNAYIISFPQAARLPALHLPHTFEIQLSSVDFLALLQQGVHQCDLQAIQLKELERLDERQTSGRRRREKRCEQRHD